MKSIIKSLWRPSRYSHKGQNGRLLVVGGSREYHGAPIFSMLAARRFVDLVYFYPGERDEALVAAVKKNVPEAIVVGSLDDKKIKNVDCMLFGIGIGKATVKIKKILKKSNRIVIDGDGLKKIKNEADRRDPAASRRGISHSVVNSQIGSLQAGGYSTQFENKLVQFAKNKKIIITPHEGEFKFLFDVPGTRENVRKMAGKFGVVILKKDPKGDIISDGTTIMINKIHNQGMTKGGTGDVLSGLCAALFCKNNALKSAYAAAYINGLAGERLKKKFGFNFCASDLANEVAKVAGGR